MDINITLLEKHLKNLGEPVNIKIDVKDNPGLIGIIRGEHPEGSRVEYLEPSDFYDILVVNNIFEKIKVERDSFEEKRLAGRVNEVDENIENYIYDTLAKYIVQILNAAVARIFYPEIVPLQKHKRDHFRDIR
ncbi:MAG: hypothetical protein JST70_14035 [Bacteroidetes bacterium]|nr:hypothetical protein [Bacteroidota bacterium]